MVKTLAEFPALLAQWHPSLNGSVITADVEITNPTRFWWLDAFGHEWQARIINRLAGHGCIYCSNQMVLAGFNDLATTHPHLAAQWHPTLNNGLTPQEVTAGSERKVWWLDDLGHEWPAAVHPRSGRHVGCPYCANRAVLAGFNDLQTRQPALAAQWHPTLNGSLLPTMVSEFSNRKVWWLGECGHQWHNVVAGRSKTGAGCPYCANRAVLAGFNDLATTHPHLAAQWHPIHNGDLKPTMVLAGSGKKVWWVCMHNHAWPAPVVARTGSGTTCPYCTGNLVASGYNDLLTKYPDVAVQWHPTRNGDLTPAMVSAASSQYAWWQCDKGHEWPAIVANRTTKNAGCPRCANHVSRGETELAAYIAGIYDGEIKRSDRTVLGGRELDIYLPDLHIAIEYNGLYWHSELYKEPNYHRDKWLACKELGVQLIQVWEDDWQHHGELVRHMLAHKLRVRTDKNIYARTTQLVDVTRDEAKTFLTMHHLQGYLPGTYIGLRSGSEIVAVLGVKFFGKSNTLEITRFATAARVTGGFGKLLAAMIKRYPAAKMLRSYSHNDHATGNMYAVHGFATMHTGQPGYAYLVGDARVHRLHFTRQKLASNMNMVLESEITERELAQLQGLTRVWDAGSTLWTKTL